MGCLTISFSAYHFLWRQRRMRKALLFYSSSFSLFALYPLPSLLFFLSVLEMAEPKKTNTLTVQQERSVLNHEGKTQWMYVCMTVKNISTKIGSSFYKLSKHDALFNQCHCLLNPVTSIITQCGRISLHVKMTSPHCHITSRALAL